MNAGSILNHAAHSSRSRFADVRELVSSAIERISPIGLRVNIATESTASRRRNRDARHDEIFVAQPERLTPGVFERGDQAEVDLVRLEQLGAARRHVEADPKSG